jgi:hypothetical protein
MTNGEMCQAMLDQALAAIASNDLVAARQRADDLHEALLSGFEETKFMKRPWLQVVREEKPTGQRPSAQRTER